jgi:SAM-dependent methyltransferase
MSPPESGPMRSHIVEVQAIVDRLLQGKRRIMVLEAGCGSLSHLRLGPDTYVVGIDISERQLARNSSLHEKILGDLQTYGLPRRTFDLIVCWDVLEHLPRPTLALRKFLDAVSDDGLIVLAFPNVLSLKGIVAKLTPFWVHWMVYRFLYGAERLTTTGHQPFPTYLRLAIRPSVMRQFALANQLVIEHFLAYESGMQRRFRTRCGLVATRWRIAKALVTLLSGGTIDAERSDCLMVLRRRPGHRAGTPA